MTFQSFHFLVFFLVVFGVANFLIAGRARKLFLIAASYYFYMLWDWRFAGILLFLTAANYIIGHRMEGARSHTEKKLYLSASLIISLGILAYFKYVNFFIDSINSVLTSIGFAGELELLQILLPVGISFYTFQAISYTLDIYRERLKPIHDPIDFALFVSFFPQLVAGPIVRASHFLPQLQRDPDLDSGRIQEGVALMIQGFIKKIFFADLLALHFVDAAFATPEAYSPLFLLLGVYAYSFQIYMDFSGYTDIARGVARTLGYELQINFHRPYKAPTVSNFWQRWHISMSSFFRDYLFFGLGGARSGNVYFNVLLTFIAIGVWHGAGWNFVVYGMVHGSFVAGERWLRNRRKARGLAPAEYAGFELAVRIFCVFHFVAFARLLFRAGSIGNAGDYALAMTDFSQSVTPVSALGLAVLLLAAALHYVPDDWKTKSIDWFARAPALIQATAIVSTIYGLAVFSGGPAPFIYFQF